MKFENLIGQLLVEIDKREVLIKKVGLNDFNADTLVRICGPLAVLLGNKLIDRFTNSEKTRSEIIIWMNENNSVRQYQQQLTSIMDWVRAGLDGNIGQYKSLPFLTLWEESVKWHDSLGEGEGDIDYEEKNDIVLDFRKDGMGFYWVNLGTNDSREECTRMGHCGRTGYGNTIFSLRETKRISPKHTKNVSHITAAVGGSSNYPGLVFQMKGEKNSKPKEEYFPYIVPFVLSKYVTGFGSEYNSKNDFKLSDLPENDIKKIYKKKPKLFTSYADKKILWGMGIIEKPNMVFTLEVEPDRLDSYVDGDWDAHTWTDKSGIKHKTTLFELILRGDTWELYERGGYDSDWSDALDYHVDKPTTTRLWGIVKKYAVEQDVELEPEMSLEDAIKEVDGDHDIRNAIRSALHDEESNSYHNHVYKILKECCEKLGEVLQMNDEGVKIKIDLDNFLNDVDGETLDEYMENCNSKLDCVFGELMGNSYIDKPKFDYDDRWYPDVDNKGFNETLQYRLDEI